MKAFLLHLAFMFFEDGNTNGIPIEENIRATSATAEMTDQPEPAGQKFYRVLLLQ